MFYTTLFGIVIIVLYIADYILNYNENAKLMRLIPGLKENFLIGNALPLLSKSPEDLFKKLRKWASEFNGIYRISGFFISGVNIYNPEDIEIVLSTTKNNDKSLIYKLMKSWLGDGLLISNASKWQQRRKLVAGAFHSSVLRKHYPIIDAANVNLLNELQLNEGKTINVVPLTSEFSLTVLCGTIMGMEIDEEHSKTRHTYKEALTKFGELYVHRIVNVFMHPDCIFKWTPAGRKYKKYVSIMHKFRQNIVNSRRNHTKESVQNVELDDNRKNNKIGTILDLLLTLEKGGLIDDAGIHEEMDNFMLAGYDSIASGLTFCLLSFAENPLIQDKIVEELENIFQGNSRSATIEDLTSMSYLERCIKESLRLFPPAPIIGRKISETLVLSNYTIPKGTSCQISIYDLHRQESLFKNALQFDPDRFLPENSVGRHKFAYIPFSAGARNCIGNKFAMMELKSALCAILRKFKIIPVTKSSEIEYAADIVLRTSQPILLQFINKS